LEDRNNVHKRNFKYLKRRYLIPSSQDIAIFVNVNVQTMRRLLQVVSADFQGQWDKLRVHPRSAATSRDSSLFLTTLQGLPCAMLGQCGVERLTCGAE
jgi:hypothetical protein